MTSKTESIFEGSCHDHGSGIFQIGKNSVTPEVTAAVSEALEARELIKISVSTELCR